MRVASWELLDWRDYHEERADILQHDAGLPRPEAERRAFRECVGLWLAANPPPPCPPDRCAGCGGAVPPRAEGAVPLLRTAAGPEPDHVWVHECCLGRFRAAREALARDRLAVCSIREPPRAVTGPVARAADPAPHRSRTAAPGRPSPTTPTGAGR